MVFTNKNLPTRTYARSLKPKEEATISYQGEIPTEYENACRLCLENGDIMTGIFTDKVNLVIPIVVKIRSLLSLEVNEDDELPSAICEQCLNKLNEAYNFKKQCLANDVKLRQFLCKWPQKTHYRAAVIDRIDDGCVLDESHLTDKKDFCTFEWDDQVPLAAVITSKELTNSNLSREGQGFLVCNNANQPREDYSSIPGSEPFCFGVDYKADEQSLEDDICVEDNSTETGNNNQASSIKETSSILNKELHVTSTTSDKQLQATSDTSDKQLQESSVRSDKQQLQETNNYILVSSSKDKNKETEPVDRDDIPLQRRLEMESETENSLEPQIQNGNRMFRRNLLENQCPRCRMVFPCAMLFREHVNICAPKFICNNCSKVFRTPSLVVRHMRIHTGERPYQCEICKSSFNQKEILQRHIAQRHATNRPYKCKMCPKAYALPLLLSAHIRASHYVQNFKCNLCPKKFRHASGLSRHQHHHNGTVYICKMCSKRFSDASSIRRHIKVHNIMDNNSDSESESVEGDA